MAQSCLASTATVSEPFCHFTATTIWRSLWARLTGRTILSVAHRWLGCCVSSKCKRAAGVLQPLRGSLERQDEDTASQWGEILVIRFFVFKVSVLISML